MDGAGSRNSGKESSDGNVRSLWEETQGRGPAVLQRGVPGRLHGEIEAWDTELGRPNHRQTAAQARTLKGECPC